MSASDLIARCKDENVRFVRLQFSELHGQLKNVQIPVDELDKALDGEMMFDGSSIRGYKRIEQSDMYFRPDPATFQVIPWLAGPSGNVARIICDVADPDGTPFAGDPRVALKKVIAEAAALGYSMNVGPEAEFFIFNRDADGTPRVNPHDTAGYFDVGPMDKGEEVRRDIEDTLVQLGFYLEASHHEVAIGQHEIDFRHADALSTADNLITFRYVVRSIAAQHGMHATFMPKPIFGENGSGMHCNQSLSKDGKNVFFDPNGEEQLSDVAYGYIAGLLAHLPGITAIANPIVNSYKRLVPGYEAPVYIAWSPGNRSAAIRIPAKRGNSTRAELRTPDPTANPYLLFAAMLAAGLDGIKQGLKPPAAVNQNIYHLSDEESAELGIENLPHNLSLALDAFAKDDVLTGALGTHISEAYVAEKRREWKEYQSQVHGWETDRYLEVF
ncbi:MAG: type I glutamate--ammonia ligase [Thermoleophilia bacterium]